MRLLEKKSKFSMSVLGMNPKTLDSFRYITSPYGIILVCGPTVPEKQALSIRLLVKSTPQIVSLLIEDPIEYEASRDRTNPSGSQIGLTFGRVIRAHLRQDRM